MIPTGLYEPTPVFDRQTGIAYDPDILASARSAMHDGHPYLVVLLIKAALPVCSGPGCGKRVTGHQHLDDDAPVAFRDTAYCSPACRDDAAEAASQHAYPVAGWGAMGGIA